MHFVEMFKETLAANMLSLRKLYPPCASIYSHSLIGSL